MSCSSFTVVASHITVQTEAFLVVGVVSGICGHGYMTMDLNE